MNENQQPDIAAMLLGAADTICAQTGVDLREWVEWAANGGMLEMVMAHAVGRNKDARIRELEAQLNAAILARREAQQAEQAAIEARNRAGVEIRRPLLERIRDLEQDAARYRWLRDVSVPPHNFYISVPDEFAGVRYEPPEVDAYIDAAMASQKGGE